jgi:hypothetical protein
MRALPVWQVSKQGRYGAKQLIMQSALTVAGIKRKPERTVVFS